MSSAAPSLNDESAAQLRTLSVTPSGELDSLLFQEESVFDLPLTTQRELVRHHVEAAHLRACERNADYRKLAERADLSAPFDPERLPAIPTGVFKRRSPLLVPSSEVVLWAQSSGTLGRTSSVGRDRTTLERLLGSVHASLALLREWHEDELEIVHLGPSREEAGDVWFAYVMSLLELLYPTRARVTGGVLQVERAIADVRELLAGPRQVALVGAPFLVLELSERVLAERQRFNAGERLTVITAGGWKRWAGSALPKREFRQRIQHAFGLHSEAQVRDAFNQVELNTVLMECEAHEKHVPPWVFACARDPVSLRVLPRDTIGLLSFHDASASSYPCFIVGDDVGEVREGRCACGRDGVRVNVLRRVEGREHHGCALRIDRELSS
jgi:long-chain-fatty-acid---luciferin-component ligase